MVRRSPFLSPGQAVQLRFAVGKFEVRHCRWPYAAMLCASLYLVAQRPVDDRKR